MPSFSTLSIILVLGAMISPAWGQAHPAQESSIIRSPEYQLIRASKRRDVAAILRLINEGADVNATYKSLGLLRDDEIEADIGSLLAFAKSSVTISSKDSKQVVDAFKRSGANFDSVDFRGRTALHFAVSGRQENLAILLLISGADPNVCTNNRISCADETYRITPLHEAYWSAEVRRQLVKFGANEMAKDSHGKTPRDWLVAENEAQLLGLQ